MTWRCRARPLHSGTTWRRVLLSSSVVCLAAGAGAIEAMAQSAYPSAAARDAATLLPERHPVRTGNPEIERALERRDWARAETLLVAEIERTPDSPDLLKTLGNVFLFDRKPLNAAIAFKKAEAIAPLDAESRFRLALAYIALGRRDWARPELGRLASTDPSNPIYTYWLGRLDYDDGQYASAVERLRQVADRDPDFVRAFDNLGLCYEALNRPDEAIASYRRALALNRRSSSGSPWPPLNLGVLLRTRGELEEAEALFREALRHDGDFAPGHYQLGTLLEQTGRVKEAESALSRAAAADAAYAEPHYALARIYRRQGRAAEADQALATFQRLRDASREARR